MIIMRNMNGKPKGKLFQFSAMAEEKQNRKKFYRLYCTTQHIVFSKLLFGHSAIEFEQHTHFSECLENSFFYYYCYGYYVIHTAADVLLNSSANVISFFAENLYR